MRYLIFDQKSDAQSAQDSIFSAKVASYRSLGYTGNVQSGIRGKRLGKDIVDNASTTAYAIPVQRSDGKWVIRHPEERPDSSRGPDITPGLNGLLNRSTIENYQDSWFSGE